MSNNANIITCLADGRRKWGQVDLRYDRIYDKADCRRWSRRRASPRRWSWQVLGCNSDNHPIWGGRDENRANRRLDDDDDACLSRNFSIYFVRVSTTRVVLTFAYLWFSFDETHFPVSRRRIPFNSLRAQKKTKKRISQILSSNCQGTTKITETSFNGLDSLVRDYRHVELYYEGRE